MTSCRQIVTSLSFFKFMANLEQSQSRILLYRNEIICFFYFSGTFPASEYLFSAPRGLHLVEFEYLRKVLVHGLIYSILSTCAKG